MKTLRDFLGSNPDRKISFKPKNSSYTGMKIYTYKQLLESLPQEWLRTSVRECPHPTTKQWDMAYLEVGQVVYEIILTDML